MQKFSLLSFNNHARVLLQLKEMYLVCIFLIKQKKLKNKYLEISINRPIGNLCSDPVTHLLNQRLDLLPASLVVQGVY